MSAITADLDAGSIADRHEHDVAKILTEMRRSRRLIDAVIDVAYDLALDRGETTFDAEADFKDWSRRVVLSARTGSALTSGSWSEPMSATLRHYVSIAETPGMTAAQARSLLADNQPGGLTKTDHHVAELVEAVLIGSLTMWAQPATGAPGSAKKKDGIDGSQVVRADVMGAITGAAGAAVSTWWTGPLSGAAVAGATATGAVLGSAVDAVLQDAGNDAAEDAEPATP